MSSATRPRAAELEAQMKAIAPETGITVEITSSTPPLGPEAQGEAEALARRLTGDNGSHVVAYGTEGGLFQGAGWSTVVCGPGDIAQAHQPDEFITVGAARCRRAPSCAASSPNCRAELDCLVVYGLANDGADAELRRLA